MNHKKRRRVAILGFEGAMALDIVGPFDAFSVAAVSSNVTKPQTCYEVVLLALTKSPFSAESGLIFKPHGSIDEDISIDTLIVPGGVGLRVPKTQAAVAAWIKRVAPNVRRVATVCTGVYGVAPTGLLDGHTVTTHWKHAKDLAEKFPRLEVDARPLFCKKGKMYTCGGITAGIDLSLALIEEDYGPGVALAVARELVVYLKRPGDQAQYSEPLRLNEAKTRLVGSRGSVEAVARSLGFERQMDSGVHLSGDLASPQATTSDSSLRVNPCDARLRAT